MLVIFNLSFLESWHLLTGTVRVKNIHRLYFMKLMRK